MPSHPKDRAASGNLFSKQGWESTGPVSDPFSFGLCARDGQSLLVPFCHTTACTYCRPLVLLPFGSLTSKSLTECVQCEYFTIPHASLYCGRDYVLSSIFSSLFIWHFLQTTGQTPSKMVINQIMY